MISALSTELLIKFKSLEENIAEELTQNDAIDNVKRRVLYSDLELCRLDLLESELLRQSVENSVEIESVYQRMDVLVKKLKLIPVKRRRLWWAPIEVAVRFVGVSCSFMLIGMFCSLPLLLLRSIDKFLETDPFEYISEFLKRRIAWFFLFQSGIDVEVQGLQRSYFKDNCVLMTFTHASNLDGFLVSGTCPIRQLAFGKKELFIVPFFSWISLAFGGVPVDRNNRDRAVKALKRSTDAAKNEKLCIAIAPEGTRSLSGQLLPFKKGTFYMWEEMQAPILPFVIVGAYDLYPVGSWVNQTGRVIVRYLPPIYPAEATNKDHMMRLVRRRMLQSLRDCEPGSVGRDISFAHWAMSMAGNLTVIALCVLLFCGAHFMLVRRFSFSLSTVLISSTFLVFFITAALYIYYVYIVDSENPFRCSTLKKNK